MQSTELQPTMQDDTKAKNNLPQNKLLKNEETHEELCPPLDALSFSSSSSSSSSSSESVWLLDIVKLFSVEEASEHHHSCRGCF